MGAWAAIVVVASLSYACVTTSAAQAAAPVVRVAATGQGTVSSANGKLRCPGVCSVKPGRGSILTLTATPADGWTFGGWSGACTGAAPMCTGVVQGAATVTATFTPAAGTINLAIAGPGAVSSSPAGLDCGSGGAGALTQCSAGFPQGTTVSLTQAPAADGAFVAWGGACESTDAAAACDITVNDTPANAAGTFGDAALREEWARRHFRPSSIGAPAAGSLTSDPPGLVCSGLPVLCTGGFDSGTLVTVTGPAIWGGACIGVGPCTIDVDVPINLLWTLIAQQFGVNVTVSGPGSVIIGAPKPLTCNRQSGLPGCQTLIAQGATVQLTAVPTSGRAKLQRWAGACTGARKSCSLTVAQALNVGAAFAAK